MNLSDPPELVALCREGEDGQEEVAGWAMVLADQVVGYIPDRSGVGGAVYDFESVDSVACLLGHADIYPRRRQGSAGCAAGSGTVPHAVNGITHHRRS